MLVRFYLLEFFGYTRTALFPRFFIKFGYKLALKKIGLESAWIHSDILFVRIAIPSDCSNGYYT